MSNANSMNIAETVGIVSCIDPDAYTTGAVNDDVIDMHYYHEVAYLVLVGDLGSSATADFIVKGDTASNGSFSTTITGKSITQLTDAGTDSNKQVVVRVSAEQVAAQGLRYIRATLTIGTATSDAGVVCIAFPNRYAPISSFDLSSVDEIIM